MKWDPKAKYAKARVIYSFGREDEVDRAALERLAASISRFLSPGRATAIQGSLGQSPDFEFVSSKTLGGVWLLEGLWQQLEMGKILKRLFSKRQHQIDLERLLFAMVANRALNPSSKLGMEDWVKRSVHIPGLEEVSCHQLYRAMDELASIQSELDKQIYWSVSDLMNLEVDLIYFDTTSSYFEVDPLEAPEEEVLRKLGYSKDKRPDLLQ